MIKDSEQGVLSMKNLSKTGKSLLFVVPGTVFFVIAAVEITNHDKKNEQQYHQSLTQIIDNKSLTAEQKTAQTLQKNDEHTNHLLFKEFLGVGLLLGTIMLTQCTKSLSEKYFPKFFNS